jgi:hypothetical protein
MMDAVCPEPPASRLPGNEESPKATVTRSSGRPSRSAVTIVWVVAVPIPMSLAGTSTVAWPVLSSLIRAPPPGKRW